MVVESWLRLIAGALIVASVVLGVTLSPWWLAFTGIIGLNLIQSAWTDWCPMMWLLSRLGVQRARA